MRALLERWWYGRDPIIGIDIGDDSIVCADVDLRGTSRWLTIDSEVTCQGARRILGNAAHFALSLREFIAAGPFRRERCAVGLPESFTYISRVILPKELAQRSERIRYEAALESVFLRPNEVRGKLYPLPESDSSFLVVAAKVGDVEPVEDVIRSAGIELTCLTSRVFALHHLAMLLGADVAGDLIACYPLASNSHQFHLFECGHYISTIRDWSDLLRELDRAANEAKRLSLLVCGDHERDIFLKRRYSSFQFINVGQFSLLGSFALAPERSVAGALSLWEVPRV